MDSQAGWGISFRQEASRLTAMLVRHFGHQKLDLIEDAVQETFIRALKAWKTDGLPENWRGWLALVAKRIAIDKLRRERIYVPIPSEDLPAAEPGEIGLGDEELSLFYLCCHPRLSPSSQIMLTLREVGGFTTREVARCLLISETTAAQRLVRIKRTLREIDPDEDPERSVESVQRVLYLMFNQGYSFQTKATPSEALALCDEAISLALRLSRSNASRRPATLALLALMYLQSSRIRSRIDEEGTPVTLGMQHREKWDHARISQGLQALAASAEGDAISSYHIEAGIAAEYATCDPATGPSWERLLSHYDDLVSVHPTDVVRLNRAIVVGMVHGPETALSLLDILKSGGRLTDYHYLDSARAYFLDRASRKDESRTALADALSLVSNERDRKLLLKRLADA